jgi:biotin operon repressor
VNWGNKKEERPIFPAAEGLLNEMRFPDVQGYDSLEQEPYEPIHWVVQDILPVGLTVLAADPKSGKSYLSQHITIAVASGTQAMGRFDVTQGDVLCLSLEDAKNRFKQRLHRLLDGNPAPSKAYFARKWAQLPDAAKQIRAWIKQADNPQLIVVDTFAKVRGRPKRWDTSGLYERDYQEVSLLQDLAQDYQVALLLIHHTNKGDADDDFRRISGTQGLTGAADAMWLMQTNRENMEATLVMAGREIADKRLWLRMDEETGIWKCAGTLADMKRKQGECQVMEAIEEMGVPVSQADIAKYCGVSRQTINKSIKSLLEDGIVEKSVTGKFMLAPGLRGTATQATPMQPRNFNGLQNDDF